MLIQIMENYPLILAAAGKSTRLGFPKGLYRCGNQFWIELQFENLTKAGIKMVYLVLGYDLEHYIQSVPEVSYESRCHLIVNPAPELGPFSSLHLALKDLARSPTVPKAVFYLPIDTPVPKAEVISTLIEHLTPERYVSIPSYEGRKGHPVLLSWEFCKKLLNLDVTQPSARLDTQIHSLDSNKISHVPVADSNITYNLNSKKDFESFLKV